MLRLPATTVPDITLCSIIVPDSEYMVTSKLSFIPTLSVLILYDTDVASLVDGRTVLVLNILAILFENLYMNFLFNDFAIHKLAGYSRLIY